MDNTRWLVLVDAAARCYTETLQDPTNSGEPLHKIGDLHVDIGDAQAATTAGDLAQPHRLQFLMQGILDFVSAAKRKIGSLQDHLEEYWIWH